MSNENIKKNLEEIKEQNNLISEKLNWLYEDVTGSGKMKVWKDTREPGRIILRNEFDKNFGLLMEVLEKILLEGDSPFQYQILFNECIIEKNGIVSHIQKSSTTHQAVYDCLIKYLKECQ